MSDGKSKTRRALIRSALRSADVSFEAAALFLLIESFANPDGSKCFPSMELLASNSGHDVKWIKRRLKELREAGWITSRHKPTPKGRVNIYTLHWAQIGPDRVRVKITPTGRAQNGPKTYSHKTYKPPTTLDGVLPAA